MTSSIAKRMPLQSALAALSRLPDLITAALMVTIMLPSYSWGAAGDMEYLLAPSSRLPVDDGHTYAFQSSNYPERRIRHKNFLGYLDPIGVSSSQLAKNDSSFFIHSGLSNASCYSFAAKKFPSYYLRHQGYRVKLQLFTGDKQFKDDATFCKQPALNGIGMSFAPINLSGQYYIRHRGFELYLDPFQDNQLYRNDASFVAVHGF